MLAGNFAYHASGALTSVDCGNGTTSQRSFNSGLQLKTLQHGTTGNPGQFLDLEYDYGEGVANTGRILGITDWNDTTKSVTYTYDHFNRLETAETAGSHWGALYGYDRYGNLLSRTRTRGSIPEWTRAVSTATTGSTPGATTRPET